MFTDKTTVSKLESPIPVPQAADFVLLGWSLFANRDVMRCSWDPDSSRARQGTKIPERFLTNTLWSLHKNWGFKRYENIIKLLPQMASNFIQIVLSQDFPKWFLQLIDWLQPHWRTESPNDVNAELDKESANRST